MIAVRMIKSLTYSTPFTKLKNFRVKS